MNLFECLILLCAFLVCFTNARILSARCTGKPSPRKWASSILLLWAILSGISLPAAASSVSCTWYADSNTLYQVQSDSNQITHTLALKNTTDLAMNGSDCRVWALADDQLTQYDSNASQAWKASLKTFDARFSSASQIVANPYDNSTWIASSKVALHLGADGRLLGSVPVPGTIRRILLALDESLWVLGNKQLWHFNAQGTLLATQDLHNLVNAEPKQFALDSLTGMLWLAGEKELTRLNLQQPAQPPLRIDLPAQVTALTLDPLPGQVWLALANGQLLGYDRDGTLLHTIDLQANGFSKVEALEFDALTQSLWLADKQAAGRFSLDGKLLVRLPATDNITALAAPVFTLKPTLTLIRPPQDALTNNAEPPIVYSYDALCNNQACAAPQAYLDGIRLQATLNQNVINPFVLDSVSRQATYTPGSKLPEGLNSLVAQAKDSFGHTSETINSQFTVDTIPPKFLTVTPAPGSVLTVPQATLQGTIDDINAAVVLDGVGTAAGTKVNGTTLAFSFPMILAPGSNTFKLSAIDKAGNVGTTSLTLTFTPPPPPAPVATDIVVGKVTNGMVTVTGSAGAVNAGLQVVVTNTRTQQAVTVNADNTGSFSTTIAAQAGDVLAVKAVDQWGGASSTAQFTAASGIIIPPDPATVATPVNPTVPTKLAASTAFLYTGSNPIQTGVAPETIEAKRAAVLRGRVLTRDNQPLAGVKISVLNHPEFGQTISRADGMFDMAVNGGSTLTVVYEKSGIISSQRQVYAPWKDFVWLPDVVLIGLDAQVATVDLAKGSPQVAQGSPVTDTDGTRQAMILFPANTTASMILPDGSSQPLDTLHVRATEFTVGPNGPNAMPASLPPTTSYTYAVELSVDEAIAAGAKQVVFNQPVPFYVDNFLGFPVGTIVPVGYYDQDKGRWVGSKNGKVIRILSVTNGLADIEIDGTGAAASPTALAALGISDAERQQLGALYPAGKSIWRAPLMHFSTYDLNWIQNLRHEPTGCDDEGKCVATESEQDCEPCTKGGSIIEAQNQVLGERIPVTGTPFTLNYRSNRMPGFKATSLLRVPLTNSKVPNGLTSITLDIQIAGQHFEKTFSALPNQTYTFAWDGKDAYGREVMGKQQATVQIGYVYDTDYIISQNEADYDNGAYAWSNTSVSSTVISTSVAGRARLTVSHRFTSTLTHFPSGTGQGLGGWSLDVNHVYDRENSTLLLGDGSVRAMQTMNVDLYTQPGFPYVGIPGLAVNPAGAILVAGGATGLGIRKIATDGTTSSLTPNGWSIFNVVTHGQDIYFSYADFLARNIAKLSPDGTITLIAGKGSIVTAKGTGVGPALSVVVRPVSMAIDQEGNIYFSEQQTMQNNSWVSRCYVKKLSVDGYVSIVAGDGSCFNSTGDGGPAIQAQLYKPDGLAVDSQGNLYIADEFTVRKVTPDGIIDKVAGDGIASYPADGNIGDGGPATAAHLGSKTGSFRVHSIAIDNADRLLIASRDRIRRVGSDGIIDTIAGGASPAICTSQAGGPALAFCVTWFQAMSVDHDNNLMVFDGTADPQLRKIHVAQQMVTQQEAFMPSLDGTQLYVFDHDGKHKRTQDAKLNSTAWQFAYDSHGWLTQLQDSNGNITVIERDADGTPTAIVSPDGLRTTLTLDANSYLASVSNPAGETWQLASTADGLLTGFRTPKGNLSHLSYDDVGRLVHDSNAAGGYWQLDHTGKDGTDTEVTMTSAEGRTEHFHNQTLPDGSKIRTITAADGTQTQVLEPGDGSTKVTKADGTVTTTVDGPDPRFAMLAPLEKKRTVILPSGLTYAQSLERSVVVGGEGLLNFQTQTDTETINGKIFKTVYNAGLRQYTFTSAVNRQTIVKTDVQGRPLSQQISGILPINYGYDERGRLTSVSQGSGANVRTTAYAYDEQGNVHTITDPLGRITRYTYDLAGRVKSVIMPDTRVIDLTYDANGNVTSVTPPSRPVHGFDYNTVDLATGYTPPALNGQILATQYEYNLDKQPTKVIRPDGKTIVYGYDSGGRIASLTSGGNTVSYAYSSTSGQLASLTTGNIGLFYSYDGSLLTAANMTGPVAGTISTAYDNFFRIRQLGVNGSNIAYSYDNDGLLVSAGSLTLTRDATNGFVTGSSLGQITTTQSTDSFGQLASFTAKQGTLVLYDEQYSRDKAGRLTQKTVTINGQTNVYGYSYDTAGRLTDVTKDGSPAGHFDYDANGNRTLAYGIAAAYDEQDRLTGYGSAQYSYTDNGELKQIAVGTNVTQYDYDVFGNLKHVQLPDGSQLDYLIDGQQRRIGKKVNGTLKQGFLYQDQLKPAAELDGNGNVVARFVYAGKANVPEYMVKGNVTYRIITDQLGSVRLVLNSATGQVVQRIDYDEWGNVQSDSNPAFQPFGFAGGLYDRDTGLTRFGARDYDAKTARWTAKDPIGFNGGDTSLFNYVGGDPLNYIDPQGLMGSRGNPTSHQCPAKGSEKDKTDGCDIFPCPLLRQITDAVTPQPPPPLYPKFVGGGIRN